ncbi:MAG: NAD-dependent epimerase/dehydratase family protein [Gemmatimonadetes bacterium]|nr:NAD-dependent epimerase/dehydratase family protein [Gemmatimonadota bacterium]
MSAERHVVFGGGQIGPRLARALVERGHEVRMVRRSGGAPAGVELQLGDAGDPAFATSACAGAAAVYHCMNPAYSAKAWAGELPRLADALIAGAGRAGARLVVLDNLYMLGRPGGRVLDEDSPVAPVSKKGEIRARVAARYFDAHRRGDCRVVVGRASDFYGPGGTGTNFGDAFWPGALKKGAGPFLPNPDTPHTYHFTADVAEALAALGTAPDDVTGGWWVLPAAPAESSRALVARFAAALGRPLALKGMPMPLLRTVSLFVPILRELAEMSYQWEEPFVTDDRRFRERFGEVQVTPLDAGARATAEWAVRHYGS